MDYKPSVSAAILQKGQTQIPIGLTYKLDRLAGTGQGDKVSVAENI